MEKIIPPSKSLSIINVWPKRLYQFIIMCFLLFIQAYYGYAQDDITRKGLFLGSSLGYGHVELKDGKGKTSTGSFVLGLQAGWAITSRMILSLEFDSATIKPYVYDENYGYSLPKKGESLDNVSFSCTVFPIYNRPLYLTGGIGEGFFEKIKGDENYDDRGGSWVLGCGYEFPLTKTLTYAPQLRLVKNNLAGGPGNIKEISIALRWYPKW
jgi:hypothetical protein